MVFFYAPLDAAGLHPEDLLPPRADGDRARWSASWSPAVHAIRHLRSGEAVHDARSYVSIHLSVIFGVAVLLTGVDLGARGVGQVVGLGRAHPGQLPDRLPALCAPTTRCATRSRIATARLATRRYSRSPRAPSSRSISSPSAWRSRSSTRVRSRRARRPARLDARHLPRLPARDGAAVGLPGALRALGQGDRGQAVAPATSDRGRGIRAPKASRIAPTANPSSAPRPALT